MINRAIVCVFCSGLLTATAFHLAAGESADWKKTVQENYAKGLERMKAASGETAQERDRQYTEALAAFQAAKTALTGFLAANPDKAASYQPVLSEINSCIYWASKFRPAATKPGEKETPPREVPPDTGKPRAEQEAEEARRMLAEAEGFEQGNPEDSFRISIRYFEVADRFRKTDSGMAAMGRCLERMQRFLDEKQFSGAAEKLILEPEPPAADTKAVESAMKKLRSECQKLAKLEKKREELDAKLQKMDARYKEVDEILKRFSAGNAGPVSMENLSKWGHERDSLFNREIPDQRNAIDKQDAKIAEQRKDVDAAAEKVRQFGKDAIPVVDRYLADKKANADMNAVLENLKKRTE